GVALAVAVGEADDPGAEAGVDLGPGEQPPGTGRDLDPPLVLPAEGGEVVGMDAQRPVRITPPPRRGAEDLVGVVHPPLPVDEGERVLRVLVGVALGAEAG